MGYLDNSVTSVDAILTKHGRKLLADGSPLGISKFALSDDGVDYTLYNIKHTSGSANYDDAITSLPNLEAVPDDTAVMKYQLLTQNRKTVFMPIIELAQSTWTIEGQGKSYAQTIEPVTRNATDSGYIFKFTDASVFNITGVGGGQSFSGVEGTHPTIQDMKFPVQYQGTKIVLTAKPTSVDVTRTMQVTGLDTGITVYATIVVKANILTGVITRANAGTKP